MVNYCPECGTKLDEDAKFCPKCGHKLTAEKKKEKDSSYRPKPSQIKSPKKRNIVLVYILAIITVGIYGIYWFHSTKKEMNEIFGASIPTSILIIIPIANIYWMYKYAEGFSMKVKKDDNTILWALLFILVGIVAPAIVQSELNKFADNPNLVHGEE